MSDEQIDLGSVEEADGEKFYECELLVNVKNGDGQAHEKKLLIKYRALSTEILECLDRSAAEFVSRAAVSWNAKEELTLDFLKGRDVRFVGRIAKALTSDFFRR